MKDFAKKYDFFQSQRMAKICILIAKIPKRKNMHGYDSLCTDTTSLKELMHNLGLLFLNQKVVIDIEQH